MDDFGTGYSSLSYLRSFPFDKIKIDRCFISGLGDDDDSAAIVQAVAGLGQQPRHDDDRGRRRDAGAARSGPRARLHRGAGLFLQPAGPGKESSPRSSLSDPQAAAQSRERSAAGPEGGSRPFSA